jgi:hypothetical protein
LVFALRLGEDAPQPGVGSTSCLWVADRAEARDPASDVPTGWSGVWTYLTDSSASALATAVALVAFTDGFVAAVSPSPLVRR